MLDSAGYLVLQEKSHKQTNIEKGKTMQIENARAIETTNSGFWTVCANDKYGRECVLLNVELSWERAGRLARKVAAFGKIDPMYWTIRAPYGSLAWIHEQQEMRQIEDELYGF